MYKMIKTGQYEENIGLLEVYFESLNLEEMTEQPAYDVSMNTDLVLLLYFRKLFNLICLKLILTISYLTKFRPDYCPFFLQPRAFSTGDATCLQQYKSSQFVPN